MVVDCKVKKIGVSFLVLTMFIGKLIWFVLPLRNHSVFSCFT